MGFISFLKNLNLGVGMPHMPTTQTKDFDGPEQVNKTLLAEDNHEITGVDKGTRIKSDESGSCTSRMDWTFNHPSRKDNVEGKLVEVVSGQRRLANFKGDQGLGNVASSENAGQIECKVNFLGLPIRPGGKECPSYMRNGGCESASRCRFHHPDPTAVVGDILQDHKHGVPSELQDPVEQLCGTPGPSENTSNEQTAFLYQFTPNRGNMLWIGSATRTIPLHPQEMNINDHKETVLNKDVEYGFCGAELQHFEEYPQRPSEPECQYFMKTGYCKFKSACRYHHPKSNVPSFGQPKGLVSDNYQHHGTVEQMSSTPLPSENCSNGQRAFSGPSSSAPDYFPPKQELKPNAKSNENQTITNLLHPPKIIKTIDQQQELINKNTANEFSSGEPLHFDGYPQRPGEPECQHFIKTGSCKFKSACRYHHPKLNLSSPRPARKNYEKDGPEEQSCEKSLPSENITNDETAFLCPSSYNAPGLFTPKLGFEPNIQWNEDQMVRSPLDPPEINIDENVQEIAKKNTSYEFNDGAKSQQFDEYPQRPGKTDCQYFVKTGYCKFKSACKFHHPNPNLSDHALPPKPMAASPLDPPEIKIDEKGQKLANKITVHIFNGCTNSQLSDEYPQRPTETECQHFMKTGYCKFKSACIFHHPKPHLSLQAPPVKLIATSPLNPPPPEIKKNKKEQKLTTTDTVQEFNGAVKSRQIDEYPQRPSEPEHQDFVKTGFTKGKCACRSHHPKSNLCVPARPQKSDKQIICTHYSRGGNCKFGSACRFSHHIDHT